MKAARIILSCATRNYSRSIVEGRRAFLYRTNTKNIVYRNSAASHANGCTRLYSQSANSQDLNDLEKQFFESPEISEEELSYPSELGYNNKGFNINLVDVDFDVNELENFDSNFYNETVEHTESLQEKIDSFYEDNDIKTTGDNIPPPIFTFEEAEFPDLLLEKLKKDFDKPTPIQSLAWPIALSGRDLVGIAQTGSGKTLSFLGPAIKHIMGQKLNYLNRRKPTVVVLCPTRELALQCYEVAQSVCPRTLKVACVYGGSQKSHQIQTLNRGCNLLIATPGRLIDLIQSKYVDVSHCSYAVLDEADRMLDMGFEPQIRAIFGQIRPDRQITMWSATWPFEIKALAAEYLTSKQGSVLAKIGAHELTVNSDVEQKFHFCSSKEQVNCFTEVLKAAKETENSKILVFCNQKRTCDFLQNQLRQRFLINCVTLHGDCSQRARETAINNFKDGRVRLLIATEVAARGLDVNNITHVINFDAALDGATHIHRVGRTGRAGKKGLAHTIVTDQSKQKMLLDVIQSLRDINHPVDPKLVKASKVLRQNDFSAKRQRQQGSYNKGFDNQFSFNNSDNFFGQSEDTENRKQFSQQRYQTEKIPIDSTKVGLIIGKGGSKIKELKEQSCARIWINDNRDAVISGTQENVDYAKQLIKDLLEKSNSYEDRNTYKHNNSNQSNTFTSFNDDNLFDDDFENDFDLDFDEPNTQRKTNVQSKKSNDMFSDF